MENQPLNVQYTFSYNTSYDALTHDYPKQTSAQKSITLSEDQPWHVAMREFANFLTGIYGYDITGQLFVKERGWIGDDESFVSLTDCGV